jgi:hypothetical protein
VIGFVEIAKPFENPRKNPGELIEVNQPENCVFADVGSINK